MRTFVYRHDIMPVMARPQFFCVGHVSPAAGYHDWALADGRAASRLGGTGLFRKTRGHWTSHGPLLIAHPVGAGFRLEWSDSWSIGLRCRDPGDGGRGDIHQVLFCHFEHCITTGR